MQKTGFLAFENKFVVERAKIHSSQFKLQSTFVK